MLDHDDLALFFSLICDEHLEQSYIDIEQRGAERSPPRRPGSACSRNLVNNQLCKRKFVSQISPKKLIMRVNSIYPSVPTRWLPSTRICGLAMLHHIWSRSSKRCSLPSLPTSRIWKTRRRGWRKEWPSEFSPTITIA